MCRAWATFFWGEGLDSVEAWSAKALREVEIISARKKKIMMMTNVAKVCRRGEACAFAGVLAGVSAESEGELMAG